MGTLPARSREDILCSWLKNNGSRELGDVCPHAWSHARRSRTCGTRQANGLRRVDTWWKANEQHRDGLVTLPQKDHLLPRHLAPARTTPERSLGMRQENVDAPNVEDGGQQTARLSMPAEGSSAAALSGEAACRTLSVAVLAARCLEEIDTSRRGKPCDETYSLELFRRATTQGIKRPGPGCNAASARSCSPGCAVIRVERQPAAWRAKRPTSRWPSSASGRQLP